MNDERSMRDKEFDERWEKAKKVKIKRPEGAKKTSVFSIKMDRDLLQILVERARELEIGPSTLARGLIEQGLMASDYRLTDEAIAEAFLIRLKELRESSKFVATAALGMSESFNEAFNILLQQSSETEEAVAWSYKVEDIA